MKTSTAINTLIRTLLGLAILAAAMTATAQQQCPAGQTWRTPGGYCFVTNEPSVQTEKPYAGVLLEVQDSYRNQNDVLVTDATGQCRRGSFDRCEFVLVCNYGEETCRNLPPGTGYVLRDIKSHLYSCDEYLLTGSTGNAFVCLTYAARQK